MEHWMMNYGGTTLMIAAVALGIFFIVKKLIKDRKKGGCCGCSGCDGHKDCQQERSERR